MSNLTNELHFCRAWAQANQYTEAEMWLNARLYELEHLTADEYQVTAPVRSIISEHEAVLRDRIAEVAATIDPDDIVRAVEASGYAIVRR